MDLGGKNKNLFDCILYSGVVIKTEIHGLCGLTAENREWMLCGGPQLSPPSGPDIVPSHVHNFPLANVPMKDLSVER
jgi:hypothetical protein